MFSAKTSGPSTGGLFGGSLFGNTNTQASPSLSTPATANTSGSTGGLFSNLGSNTQSKPSGGLFGNTGATTQSSSTNMFASLGGQQNTTTSGGGGGLFGSSTTATSQPQTSGLFSGLGGGNKTTQSGTGGGLFSGLSGASTQTQSKPLFGASTTTGGGLFGTLGASQQQQQQAQKPSLSVFGDKQPGIKPAQQQTTAGQTVIPGVKVDTRDLLPTTKYESCVDEVKRDIEAVDTFILNQIKMCNELADILPTIDSQGASIPNDVEFVQGKLETMQHALENDAADIDQVRDLVARDAAEAQVAFRAIDTLKLPLQYQTADQTLADRPYARSTRKNTLALPDDVESDPTTADSINGVPVNLVEYFSQRSDEMGSVLERYQRNLKEIEGHLSAVEHTLSQQIYEFIAKNTDGAAGSTGAPRSAFGELVGALRDVEIGILGVANRLAGVKDQSQEVMFGLPSLGASRLNV